MTVPDLTNGLFELGGACLQWFNVARLLRDKEVKGVYWPITVFHVSWGAWNMYFYSYVGAPVSVAGAATLLLANTVWVALAIRYTRRTRVQAP